jgi:hypothetical protein
MLRKNHINFVAVHMCACVCSKDSQTADLRQDMGLLVQRLQQLFMFGNGSAWRPSPVPYTVLAGLRSAAPVGLTCHGAPS